MNAQTLKFLSKHLNRVEMARVRKHVADVSDLEIHFRRELERLFRDLAEVLAHQVELGQPLALPKRAFEDVYMRQFVEVSDRGLRNAMDEKPSAVATAPIMMARSRTRFPSTLPALMELWDRYRKTGKTTKRVQILSDRVRRAYLKKVQSVFEKHSEAFREGKTFEKNQVVSDFREASRAPYARAKTIVETEITHYYNRARREIYDQSGDVTHYLFVAIRDHATTAWCRSRNGVIFKKGSVLLDRNTPPCHWNCRSELLPLTAHNPRHLQLIQDKSLWAENRRLVPLPAGWNRAIAA